MKILFLTWKSFGNDDMIAAFRSLGQEVEELPYSDKDEPADGAAVKAFADQVKSLSAECVFSFNYFPVVALACKVLGMPYLSWIYDSPYVRLYHYSIAYPTNHVFVFDSSLALEFQQHLVAYLVGHRPGVLYIVKILVVEQVGAAVEYEIH